VSEIAAGSLVAVRVFERLETDYCCGGKRPLAGVCRDKCHDLASAVGELESVMATASTPASNWNTAPLRELIEDIVGAHPEYLKRDLALLGARRQSLRRAKPSASRSRNPKTHGPSLLSPPK
jgi:regulator of cell morphogenesis and NO signaling